MRGLQIVLGFIFAALIIILIVNLNQKPPRHDDDDDDDDTELVDVDDDGEDEVDPDEEDIDIADDYGTGDLQITLLWDFDGDVDLHVIEPSGYEIGYMGNHNGGDNYNAKAPDLSPGGGQLDHDNSDGGQGSAENIYWKSNPPRGTYEVQVVYFYRKEMGPDEATVRVLVQQAGRPAKTYRVKVKASPYQDDEDFDISMLDHVHAATITIR